MALWDLGLGLLGQAAAAGRQAVEVARRATDHAHVDGRRLFISDAALARVSMVAARALAPDSALEVEPGTDGYLVRAVVGGRPVSARLVLERVTFGGGSLRLGAATPDGISLPTRPAVERAARMVTRAAGGTRLARRLLGLVLPAWLAWDGRRGELIVRLDGVPVVGPRLGRLDASAAATHADGGLWLEFDRDGVAEDLLGVLLRSALEAVLGAAA